MNPADTSSHSHLTRSKRTRHTSLGPDDSVKLPATKKRRSALQRNTFEPLAESTVNELAGQARHDAKTNGSAVEPAPNTSNTNALTIRGGKKTEKRSERGVGLLTLSTNDFYTVSQLPALPEVIRAQPTVAYSCVISPENDYILALTHTDARVWSYNASTTTPTSRELLNISLPFPPATTEDSLPLAAFTSKSANGEPGIVVVSPKWGKVIYWETLTSASSFAPSQAAKGVQGSIPGMFSGETVKALVPAEPAGFILSLASGRVAQLTIRDQVGRPAIGFQFMRKSAAATIRGGIFGSIRHVFGADRRKGTAIVTPGRAARAQRDLIVATEDADLEFWSNNLLTGNNLSRTVNVKDQLLAAVDAQIEKDELPQPVQFKLIDLTTSSTPASHDLVRADDLHSQSITFLVALSSQGQSNYYLIETTIADDGVIVRVVHPVRCYSYDIQEESGFRPRICIPSSSSSTAFIVFEKAIVILSLAKISESPSSQLVAEKSTLPVPFQDCILLQDNTIYRNIDFAGEHVDSISSCVLAIQGFGIARITSHLVNDNEVDIEDVVSQLSAKAKIDQAIFFGTKPANPFDLRRSAASTHSRGEIREAILSIAREIVKSTSKHIPKSSSSIAEHLQLRARALQNLVDYCLKTYSNCLSRGDRFLLLWHAEKIATAQAMWKVQEKIQNTYPRKDDRKMTYWEFTLWALSDDRQKYPKPEKGENDRIRHWLTYSVNEIFHLLVELQDAMHELKEPGMNLNDPRIVCDYFLEGTELYTTALQTAYRYREDNAVVYELGNETFDRGVLRSGYPTSLITPWTSTEEQVVHGQDYVTDICRFLAEWWDYSPINQNGSANPKLKKAKQMPTNSDGNPYDAPSKVSLERLADRLPLQVDLLNRVIQEYNIQQRCILQENKEISQEQKDHGVQGLISELRKITSRSITMISPFNRDGSLALAEAQKDSDLLVNLNIAYIAALHREQKAHPDDQEVLQEKIRAVRDHAETYFDQFGNDWAYAQFSSLIKSGQLGSLVDQGQRDHGKRLGYLSWFFEASAKQDQKLGKLAWLHYVTGEKNYTAACQTLETVASTEESDIWSKKTELCLAKLAGLAALEDESPTINETNIDNITFELEYLQIIDSLAFHINNALYDAVDDQAAVQIAVERFIPKHVHGGKKAQQTRKHLTEVLYKLVTNQTISLSQLVDALTLLDLGTLHAQEARVDVDDISGSEYPFALQAIDLAPLREATQQQKLNLKMTVWRRLLIADDWTTVNNTSGKSDKQVKDIMQRTALFRTLLDLIRRAELEKIEVHIPSIDEILNLDAEDEKSEEAKAEIAQLKKFVEKARLKEHFGGLIKEARDELRRYQDQEGEAVAEGVITNGNGVNGDHHST